MKLPPPVFEICRFRSSAFQVIFAPTASQFDFLPINRMPSQWLP